MPKNTKMKRRRIIICLQLLSDRLSKVVCVREQNTEKEINRKPVKTE